MIKLKDLIKEDVKIQLEEGIYDPGILKAVFLAGGPGSGKTFVASDLFRVEKFENMKASFSSFGLKVVNSDSAFERELDKNGINQKELARIEKEEPELWDKIMKMRGKAKALTQRQKKFYEQGRLGMIIDGTGRRYSKIERQKKHAEKLGYDCFMVFVNTSLEVALERNQNRDRVLPEELVREAWQAVQDNMGKFQSLFGSRNFRIVDNTVYKPIDKEIHKATSEFINRPLYNKIGKQWIETKKALKKNRMI